jgi:hypothetical protein
MSQEGFYQVPKTEPETDDHSARDRNNNDTSITTRPALTYRQLSTVLAALRVFQEIPDEARADMEHFEDVDPLTDPEIDELCESMNLDDDPTPARVPASSLAALQNASEALTLLDPDAKHHNAVLLDDALTAAKAAPVQVSDPARAALVKIEQLMDNWKTNADTELEAETAEAVRAIAATALLSYEDDQERARR